MAHFLLPLLPYSLSDYFFYLAFLGTLCLLETARYCPVQRWYETLRTVRGAVGVAKRRGKRQASTEDRS